MGVDASYLSGDAMLFTAIYGIIACALAYFMLRSRSGMIWLILRHIIAFVVPAVVVVALTFLTFEFWYPVSERHHYPSARMWQTQQGYIVGGAAAAILGPTLGMLAALLRRRRARRVPDTGTRETKLVP